MTNEDNASPVTPEVDAALEDELFLEDDDEVTPSGSGPALDPEPSPLQALQQAHDAVVAERDELREQLLRRAADAENTRRRFQKERDELQKMAAKNVLRDMVGVLDDIDRAVQAAQGTQQEGALQSLLQGVQMVQRKFVQTLERHGVRPVDSMGQRFDPNLHEAISMQEDPSVPRNTVVQEFQRAYLLHDQLLRAAMVVVSEGGPTAEEGPGSAEEADA
jgi:molecular chaperone GrpE